MNKIQNILFTAGLCFITAGGAITIKYSPLPDGMAQAAVRPDTLQIEYNYSTPQAESISANNIIWIGDSRAAGLDKKLTDIGEKPSCTFISKGGVYYKWFEETAVPELKDLLAKSPKHDVIINLGLNDCIRQTHGGSYANNYKYLMLINKLVDEFPDTDFYVLSITPVNKDYVTKYSGKNTDRQELTANIEAFNSLMRAACKAKYIDAYSYMNVTGFNTTDGVHYTTGSYRRLYKFTTKLIV